MEELKEQLKALSKEVRLLDVSFLNRNTPS